MVACGVFTFFLKKMFIIFLHNKIYIVHILSKGIGTIYVVVHNIPAAIFENQFIALRVQPPKEDM